MKNHLSFIALLATASVLVVLFQHQKDTSSKFELWKNTYGSTLDPSQEVYRKIIFYQNLHLIQTHNADPSQTYKMALNQFSIYTQQEFIERFLGEHFSQSNHVEIQTNNQDIPNIQIDWTTKGGVSRVKNQGSCGSCWAFAAVASCQSFALIQKSTADLSQQQLVDCSKSYGTHGCNGGSRELALRYIKDHGITSETAYPYKGVDGTCIKQGGEFHINAVSEVSGCSAIQTALEGRPIAVGVDAGGWSHYSSGVFSNCGTNLNHAVLLVGVVNGTWKIKNSWGTAWGEKGFIRLASGNTCGICISPAVYPH